MIREEVTDNNHVADVDLVRGWRASDRSPDCSHRHAAQKVTRKLRSLHFTKAIGFGLTFRRTYR